MKMDLFDSPPRHEQKSTARGEGRSLPFSEDGEKGVLCSLLLSPRDVLDLCQIKLRPEAFYTPAHQILFNLVAELVDSNKPIDFITLKQALKDRAQLDEIGGPVISSPSFLPPANADYYIDIIREKYLLRQMIVTCNRVVSDCYDHREEVDALLDCV
jgi:replicative DNA helicase